LEYPKIIDYSYCESFLATFQDLFDHLNTSFHPLTHILLSDSWLNSKLHGQTSAISALLSKLPSMVAEIQNRQELANPLLKSIEACIRVISTQMFKEPSAVLQNDIKVMNEMNKIKEEYETIKFQMKRMPNLYEAPGHIRRMNELETALEPIFQMCSLIKNKGKKIIREDTKEDIRDLLSYVNLMLKPDFYSLLTEIYNKDDLVYAIMHLQSHKNLFYELLKQEPYKSGLSTIVPVKEEELKLLIHKWQDIYSEIESFKKNPEFLQFCSQLLNNPLTPFEDLKLFSEKLREFHKAILHFHQTSSRFKRFRYKLFRFCLEEFNERVELIWPN
jgi:hypothetical protein